jgi:hypothetical protein
LNKVTKRKHLSEIKEILGWSFYADLVDKYDQEHAMVLGLGTPSGLFQSVMMKPQNVKSVFPLHRESNDKT